jgi:hypothetical protein
VVWFPIATNEGKTQSVMDGSLLIRAIYVLLPKTEVITN